MNGKVRRRVGVEGRLVAPVAGSGPRDLPIHTGYGVFDALR